MTIWSLTGKVALEFLRQLELLLKSLEDDLIHGVEGKREVEVSDGRFLNITDPEGYRDLDIRFTARCGELAARFRVFLYYTTCKSKETLQVWAWGLPDINEEVELEVSIPVQGDSPETEVVREISLLLEPMVTAYLGPELEKVRRVQAAFGRLEED